MRSFERRVRFADDLEIPLIVDAPARPSGLTVVLAHGAGRGMDNPFLVRIQQGLVAHGHTCVRFNFPYVARGRRLPDRAPTLEASFEVVIRAVCCDPDIEARHLFLAGKSLGGRIATHLAARRTPARGVILFGYPLHPAGRPDRLRTDHFPQVRLPSLFFAGTRDPLAQLDLLRAALPALGAPHELHVVEGANHDFRVPRSSGRDIDSVFATLISASDAWLRERVAGASLDSAARTS